MFELNSRHNHEAPPRILPVLDKVKGVYLLWYGYYQILPKPHRHSLGQRIDTLFVEIMEALAIAGFLSPEEKAPYVRLGIRKIDTLRVLLMVLWETQSINDKKYLALSVKIEEVGRNLGGWSGQLAKLAKQNQEKQNSPTKAGEK